MECPCSSRRITEFQIVVAQAVPWRQLFAASWLAGIGFTISLFIANDAFADPVQTTTAKLGILVASVVAGTVGFLLLRATTISRYDESSRIETGSGRVEVVRAAD